MIAMVCSNLFYAIAILLNFLLNSPGAKLSSIAQAPKRTPTRLRKTTRTNNISFRNGG